MELRVQVFFFVILSIAVISMASSRCPDNICTEILLSESCQTTMSYIIHQGEMCRQCDMCLSRDTPTDTRGCPILKCQIITYKPGCTSKQYFLWNGRMCPDCDAEVC